jgi:hypothetical protein
MKYKVLEKEFTMGSLVQLYVSQWRIFTFLGIIFGFIGFMTYVFYVNYTATAKLVINDSQNSSLQAFSSQFYGYSKSLQEGRRGQGLIGRHLEYLKTREFYEILLKKIEDRGRSSLITLQEKEGYDFFLSRHAQGIEQAPEKNEILQFLDRSLKVELKSDFEISVVAQAPSKSMALFLANTSSDVIVETLRDRERGELHRVEEFIVKQKEEVEQNLKRLELELAQEQIHNDEVLPASTQEKLGEYVSALSVRAQELELQIRENEKTINYLSQGRVEEQGSNLYGVGGQIEKLSIENNLMSEKLRQTQATLKKVKREVKILPLANRRTEEFRKRLDLEFARYKDLNSTLAKLEAQALSVDAKFQLLEKSHLDQVFPQIAMTNLVLLGVIFAQLIGSLFVYFKFIWDPDIMLESKSEGFPSLHLPKDQTEFPHGTPVTAGGYSEQQIAQ